MAWIIDRNGTFYIGWNDGKKDRYQSTRSKDPVIAERKRLEMELSQTVSTGLVESPRPEMVIDTLVELYKKEADLAPKTIRINKYSWGHLKRVLNNAPIGEITTARLLEFKNTLVKEGAAPATIHIYFRDINKLLGFAVDKGLLRSNPCKKTGSKKWAIERPEQEDTFRFLTEDEETRLLAVCNPLLKRMVTVALNTGLRISQVVEMDWKRYDVKEQLYIVPKQKRQKARRIPILAKCLDAMGSPKFHGRVFPDTNVDQIEKMFGRAVENVWPKRRETDDSYCTFHDLRHTFISRVCDILSPVEVRDLMGWSSVALVDRYSHTRVTNIQAKMRAAQPV